MKFLRVALFFLLLHESTGLLRSQEMRFIDLSTVRQRTELRHPPAPPSECKDGHCLGGGSGGGSVSDGAPDWRDPHALGVYLLNVSPTEINPAGPFEVEFKVLNTGRAPIELPVSPHLSDLQPADESEAFTYSSLALVVSVKAEHPAASPTPPAVAFVELYGSADRGGTTLVLSPGDWIRVRATVRLNSPDLEARGARLCGEFWLRKNVFRPQPGGMFTETHNLYPNSTPTPPIEVRIVRPLGTPRP